MDSQDNFSGSENSAAKALENLNINLQEINNLNNGAEAPSELLISEIHMMNGQNSAKKEDGELAEMEQLLKSGAFPKDLSRTFKKMQQSGKSLTNKSNDKISNAGFSEVDVNFNANEQSPSPGKIAGADGKMFIQNSESDKNGILNNFNS